jgi:S-adenosylmethionine hydrolase
MVGCFFLLTDFGLQDPYVGQLKAVLLSQFPQTGILDLSHGVRAHNICQAGFFLASSWPYLPKESIGLAVIDPGVGTERSILLFQQDGKSVLVPDNGLLDLLVHRQADGRVWRMHSQAIKQRVSSTFHGRDIFAPLACQLAHGRDPSQLGAEVSLAECCSPVFFGPSLSDGRVKAVVVHVDHFGNCVVNLSSERWVKNLPADGPIHLEHPRQETIYPVSTYAQIQESGIGILAGSQGYLELACNQHSCARYLGLDIGDHVSFATAD